MPTWSEHLRDLMRVTVVDKLGRIHVIANLFVCGGYIFPTEGSTNQGLTTQALAARIADSP